MNAVIVRLSMPSCASRVVSVAPIIAYGNPDEMPDEEGGERLPLEVGRRSEDAAQAFTARSPS